MLPEHFGRVLATSARTIAEAFTLPRCGFRHDMNRLTRSNALEEVQVN
jgi:hypothetical protein